MRPTLAHRPRYRNATALRLSTILTALTLLLSGCLHEERPPDIALVDLDAIARQTGRMAAIEKQLNEKRAELTAKLQQDLQNIREKVLQNQAQYQGQETQQADTARKQIAGKATAEFERLKQQANQKVNELRQSLIIGFRQEALPAVRKIARQKNVRAVFNATPNVVWMDKTLDITSAVLAEMGGPKSADHGKAGS